MARTQDGRWASVKHSLFNIQSSVRLLCTKVPLENKSALYTYIKVCIFLMKLLLLETWIGIVAYVIPIIKIALGSLFKIEWKSSGGKTLHRSLPVYAEKMHICDVLHSAMGTLFLPKTLFWKSSTHNNYKSSPKQSNVITITAAVRTTRLLKIITAAFQSFMRAVHSATFWADELFAILTVTSPRKALQLQLESIILLLI